MQRSEAETSPARFIGRGRELAEIRALLARERLVTLTGPGGCGKTRLALELAGDPGEHHEALVIELAPVTEPGLVASAVAEALGLRGEQPGTTLDQLSSLLRTRALLLVLDNCEHVLAETATLVARLLADCGQLSILATSREPLGHPAEVVWAVPSLTTAEAVQLFADRAGKASRTFRLTDRNQASIEKLVGQLDGMPLAIEIAAVRVRFMAPSEIAEQLERAPALLDFEHRGLDQRHRTLRATIDWSYRLLPPEEQALFRRLAVFAAARGNVIEQVAGGAPVPPGTVLELLRRLVDRSLVAVDQSGEHTRYRLLEVVRQFARERLDEHGELEATSERHARWVASLIPAIKDVGVREIADELDELRAALRFTLSIAPQHRELGIEILASTWVVWMRTGLIREGRHWIELASGSSRPAALDTAAGIVTWLGGDLVTAREHFERAAIDSPIAASFLAMVLVSQREVEPAYPHASRALEELRARNSGWWIALGATNYGFAARARGEIEVARDAHELARSTAVEAGDRWVESMALRNLGLTALASGALDDAAQLELESIQVCRQNGDTWFLSRGLDSLAFVRVAQGRPEEAAELFGGAAALRDEIGVGVLEIHRDDRDKAVHRATTELGADRYARAFSVGRARVHDDIDGLLRTPVARIEAAPTPQLRVRAFGRTRIERAGVALGARDWTYGKPRELLVYLLVYGERTREQIGHALWPDSPPAQARNSLGVALHRLRRALGDSSSIRFDGTCYAVDPRLAVWFDVQELVRARRRARAAGRPVADTLAAHLAVCELYAGDFLADARDEPWLVERRAFYRREVVDSHVAAGRLLVEADRTADAVAHFEDALALEPFLETAHLGLMQSLARSRGVAAALQHFDELRVRLADEVDAAPSAELARLASELRKRTT